MTDDPRTYEGWVSAFECSTDFEADLVRDRLDEAGIAAVVLTQRDHSFNLNVGDLAGVHVMVRPEDREAAAAVVADTGFTDAELEEAAMSADVMAPDAHSPADEAMLDSGPETLSFAVPDADDMTDDTLEEDGAANTDDATSASTVPTPPTYGVAGTSGAFRATDTETAGEFDPTHTSGPATSHTGAGDDPSTPDADPRARGLSVGTDPAPGAGADPAAEEPRGHS